MTLTEARKILERDINLFHGDLNEAIATAISAMPRESEFQSIEDRFTEVTEAIASAKEGMRPFDRKSRNKEAVCWRQCVWRLLFQEGYRKYEIAKVTGWDHSTILWGLGRVDDYLSSGDRLAIATWQELNEILNKNDICNSTSL